ncbi:YggS family pyridoxal phosphate-dependent enzyme [Thermodesulfobacterium sp. TA1]|uniref:YggS family pyridoxal phosphate-dependent enzyme n=1 Tax=Thermodesulfobacterium sp. TA1 TaxID=2234087 RepID=UPI001231E1A8|nr:YggS family pyridoxal phosphate-dependent enzyme [Thermodesulfobacterium sp. TA1]QER42355.1 YggS family pyridoxal phosphate-dependent enzyme [Thermodesulfobacterium sp. TA1]
MQDLKELLKKNYENILTKLQKACLKVGRPLDEVRVLAASKGQSIEKIRTAYELGIKLFGENYVQEGEAKIKELSSLEIEWHFIGRLQTNKVKKALGLFSVLHTLDRYELAKELQKQADKLNKVVPVLIEINIGKEPTKAGIKKEEVEEFLEKILGFKRIKIIGLMCLPPYKEKLEEVRPYFIEMRKIFDSLKPYLGEDFKELSMGTSHDYPVAIEEGATIIRIGEALFGKRECKL